MVNVKKKSRMNAVDQLSLHLKSVAVNLMTFYELNGLLFVTYVVFYIMILMIIEFLLQITSYHQYGLESSNKGFEVSCDRLFIRQSFTVKCLKSSN